MLSLMYISDGTPSPLTHKLTNLYEMIEISTRKSFSYTTV